MSTQMNILKQRLMLRKEQQFLYEKKVKETPQYLAKLIALTLLLDSKEDEASAQL